MRVTRHLIELMIGGTGSVLLASGMAATAQQPLVAPVADEYAAKSRLFVLSDIGGDPDDQQSFVRLMTYSNEIDIEGLVATTSIWMTGRTQPDIMRKIVVAYGDVRPNLMLHAKDWPTDDALKTMIASGPEGLGMAAINADSPSPGALALIKAADRPDPRPLWVSIWGGANTLAEALSVVRNTRSSEDLKRFVARLRAYSISDQDDAGSWIRREFPDLVYVVAPSTVDADDYVAATWTGIAGDKFFNNGDGADFTKVTNEWLDFNVRQKGPLGALYPKFINIMEGDTPAYLGLAANGLNSAMSPGWGGWGGRYLWRNHIGAGGPIWTHGGVWAGARSTDEVVGTDGRTRISDQATIWRWRDAFQNDFAARMDWTVKPFTSANHAPVVLVNNVSSQAPMFIRAKPGDRITLDASASSDPDKSQMLSFSWFHYREAGVSGGAKFADLSLEGAATPRVVVTPNCTDKCGAAVGHVIVAVTDNGAPALTRYRRIIFSIDPSG